MTKYARQIASARKTITKKGMLVTWFKSADTNTSDDTAPEFPSNDPPLSYVVPIVFYPSKRNSLATVLEVVKTGQVTDQLQAVIPGDVPFDPAIDDAVLMVNGDGSMTTLHVDWVNTTQPDLTPIVYELGFK